MRRMSTGESITSSRTSRISWALYDFANSAFPTVIITAVYAIYFKKVVVGMDEPGRSDSLWGIANAAAAGVVFLLAPTLGAAADIGGKKRLFLTIFTLLCVIPTGLLRTTGEGTIVWAMLLVMLSVIGFEGGLIFYNSFLPDLVDKSGMGRLSGQGWALGYIGGLGCLLAVLPLADNYLVEIPLVVASWFLVFSLPALLLLRDRRTDSAPQRLDIERGFRQFLTTLKNLRSYRRLFRFLVAYFFYNNAVITIIVFAVAFSSETLAFTTKESILLIAAMNVVASPGALVFGWLADRIGAKETIMITLLLWLLVVIGSEVAAWPGLFDVPAAKQVFWGVSILASLCIGATQAVSRGFVGQLAPDNRSAEFYGFMAFAGKGSAVLGPLVFGLVSDTFDSQRAAVATVGIFFLIGLVLLLRVPSPAERKR